MGSYTRQYSGHQGEEKEGTEDKDRKEDTKEIRGKEETGETKEKKAAVCVRVRGVSLGEREGV